MIWIVYLFSVVFLLPTVYLTVGVGWAFSRTSTNFFLTLLKSSLASTFCMTSSAIVAFLLSRYVFRTQFKKIITRRYPKFPIYEEAIKKEGVKFVFFMQFSFIPYSMLCYLFGLTEVSSLVFICGTLGMGIPNIFWCYVGSLLQNITEF